MSRVLIASITELCAADHGHDPEKLAAWTRNKSVAGVAAMLANPDMVLLVAERDDAVIAVGAVNRAGEIARYFVAPDARVSAVSKDLVVGFRRGPAGSHRNGPPVL